MSDLTLYGCSKACSLVSHIALEMTGAAYTYTVVDLFTGEQRADYFLALSRRGKVPVLDASGLYITETIAILNWLAARFPAARLLPMFGSTTHVGALSDLAWFVSGVHPAMTRMLVPSRFLPREDCQLELRAAAVSILATEFELIEARLHDRDWWLDGWSALDAYLFWIWARSGEGPIDLAPYPGFARHTHRMLSLPEVRRVLESEHSHMPCFEQLEIAAAQKPVPETH